ncbi:MAG: serine/threonine-protein phosphatase [Clostridia bacterium]|nr:serine/threonine-protein phosphatase [Clostridia bacterium]
MNFIVSGNTDIGLTKSTNQDSLSVKVVNTKQGRMVFAILCDGMGGLDKGEVASASVIRAFDNWLMTELPVLCESPIEDSAIRSQWENIVTEQNNKIKAYGAGQGVKLGTTVTAMLLTQTRYYVINVGDTRAYELYDGIRQITNDQTFVAREVALGNMTEEQAHTDERRSVLLQCVGASDEVYPDMFFGDCQTNAVYMLCCDGFRHEITSEEIYDRFQPDKLLDESAMNQASSELIELNKQRQERDNITVALIRTF